MYFAFGFLKIIIQSFFIELFNPVFLVLVFFAYKMQKEEYNKGNLFINKNSFAKIYFDNLIFGILLGLIFSIISVLIGIYFSLEILELTIFTFIITICSLLNIGVISYTYSLLAVTLISFFSKSNYVDLLGFSSFIGLVYIIQAILIFLQGNSNLVPTFIKVKDEIAGAFYTKLYWPVPVVFLVMNILLYTNIPEGSTNINEPSWWPIMVTPNISKEETFFYTFTMIPIIISYSDIFFTNKPKITLYKNALFKFLFGIMFILSAIWGSSNILYTYIITICGIFIYEYSLYIKRNLALKGNLYFVPVDKGIKILDVIKGGPAREIGIISNDIILCINNYDVNCSDDIKEVLKDYPKYIWVKLKRDKKILELEKNFYPNGINSMKAIFVEKYYGNFEKLNFNKFNNSFMYMLFLKLTKKRV